MTKLNFQWTQLATMQMHFVYCEYDDDDDKDDKDDEEDFILMMTMMVIT